MSTFILKRKYYSSEEEKSSTTNKILGGTAAAGLGLGALSAGIGHAMRVGEIKKNGSIFDNAAHDVSKIIGRENQFFHNIEKTGGISKRLNKDVLKRGNRINSFGKGAMTVGGIAALGYGGKKLYDHYKNK